MRPSSVRLVAARRLLCTAAAKPAEEVSTGPSRTMLTVGAVTVFGTVASAAAAYTTRRFALEADYRSYLRRDQPQVAGYVESTLLPEYAPGAWGKQMRIEDDADDEHTPGCIVLRSNPGATPPTPTEWTEVGRGFFRRFREGPITLSPPDSEASQDKREAPVTPSSAPVATPMTLATKLDPIAPDDDDEMSEAEAIAVAGTGAVDAADAANRLLEDYGGPDGARWGAVAETALITAWSSAPPPDVAVRLLVPEAAARRYEEALAYYAGLRVGTVLGDSQGVGVRPQPGGRCFIALPEHLRDGAYDDDDSTSPAVKFAWLRARELYAEAEAEALELSMRAVSQRAGACEGGGTALRRMHERKRRLERKVADLNDDKRMQKRRIAGKA